MKNLCEGCGGYVSSVLCRSCRAEEQYMETKWKDELIRELVEISRAAKNMIKFDYDTRFKESTPPEYSNLQSILAKVHDLEERGKIDIRF